MVLLSATYLYHTQRMKYISVTAIYNNEAYLYFIIILYTLHVLEIIEIIKSRLNYITQSINNYTFIIHNLNVINS
jgi:hypothetical protein